MKQEFRTKDKLVVTGFFLLWFVLPLLLNGCSERDCSEFNLFEKVNEDKIVNVYKSCLNCERINETTFKCGNECDKEWNFQEEATEAELLNYKVRNC